ncbi:MAG: septum formation initiator family protein [Candidatus Hydrogenedentota bacterium]|nr:MAG: septum formation initiator family protein [Candidatus Hydrogenedentota bacterium]
MASFRYIVSGNCARRLQNSSRPRARTRSLHAVPQRGPRRHRGRKTSGWFFLTLRPLLAILSFLLRKILSPLALLPLLQRVAARVRVPGFRTQTSREHRPSRRPPSPRRPQKRSLSLYDIVSLIPPARRRRLIVSLLLLASFLCTYLYLFSPTGYLARHRLAGIVAREEEHVESLRRERDALATEVDRLTRDPHTIERLARDELNMAYPNETIYRLPDGSPPAFAMK